MIQYSQRRQIEKSNNTYPPHYRSSMRHRRINSLDATNDAIAHYLCAESYFHYVQSTAIGAVPRHRCTTTKGQGISQ